MYQCQMGKQTMATPAHSLPHRTDNKLYRLLTPQAPLVRTRRYVQYGLDEYPQGTNAVVAVISYTGYDMEDAMILNKSSYERGFGHGVVYKTLWIDLDEEGRARAKEAELAGTPARAGRCAFEPRRCGLLDADGFPPVGLWWARATHCGAPLMSCRTSQSSGTTRSRSPLTSSACAASPSAPPTSLAARRSRCAFGAIP